MVVPRQYADDVQAILEKRHQHGADFWATSDGRWGKGSPFSTFDCALSLTELGMKRTDRVMKGIAEVLFATWQEDGRFRPTPKGAIYPCHTANAARALCRLGHARDRRLRRTFEHLLDVLHTDGGWRCGTCKLGRSPETDASNPGVTLAALDAFRFTRIANEDPRLSLRHRHSVPSSRIPFPPVQPLLLRVRAVALRRRQEGRSLQEGAPHARGEARRWQDRHREPESTPRQARLLPQGRTERRGDEAVSGDCPKRRSVGAGRRPEARSFADLALTSEPVGTVSGPCVSRVFVRSCDEADIHPALGCGPPRSARPSPRSRAGAAGRLLPSVAARG